MRDNYTGLKRSDATPGFGVHLLAVPHLTRQRHTAVLQTQVVAFGILFGFGLVAELPYLQLHGVRFALLMGKGRE